MFYKKYLYKCTYKINKNNTILDSEYNNRRLILVRYTRFKENTYIEVSITSNITVFIQLWEGKMKLHFSILCSNRAFIDSIYFHVYIILHTSRIKYRFRRSDIRTFHNHQHVLSSPFSHPYYLFCFKPLFKQQYGYPEYAIFI